MTLAPWIGCAEMEMPDHAWINTLPSGLQFAINVAIGLATLIGGLWAYLSQARKAGRPPHASPAPAGRDDVAIPMVQIADMSPVRQLVEEVRKLRNATERSAEAQVLIAAEHRQLRERFQDWMTEEEIERRAQQLARRQGGGRGVV